MNLQQNQTDESLEVWEILKKDFYFWTNIDQVLTLCQLDATKLFMLVLLEDNIKVSSKSISKNGLPSPRSNKCSYATW